MLNPWKHCLDADEKRDKALLSELRDVQRLHANYYLAFTNWQKRLLAAKPPPDPETVKFLQNSMLYIIVLTIAHSFSMGKFLIDGGRRA